MGRLTCTLPIVKSCRGRVLMSEQVPYGVISPECYFEVCPSEYVGDVGRLLTHVGERGPFALRSWCHLLPCSIFRIAAIYYSNKPYKV